MPIDTIYLINKLWLDPLENRDAHGYNPVGFVETEEEAKEIFANGKQFTRKDCWSLPDTNPTPEFNYTPIRRFK